MRNSTMNEGKIIVVFFNQTIVTATKYSCAVVVYVEMCVVSYVTTVHQSYDCAVYRNTSFLRLD